MNHTNKRLARELPKNIGGFKPRANPIECDSLNELTKLLEKSEQCDLHTIPSYKNIVEENLVASNHNLSPHAPLILHFLEPILNAVTLDRELVKQYDSPITCAIELFKVHGSLNGDEVENLKKEIGVTRLVLSFISLNLPIEMMKEYNKMDEHDFRCFLYRYHPLYGDEIQKLGLFLDKYDGKESIGLFAWSTLDNTMMSMANVNVQPYPLCWNSSTFNETGCKAFGEKRCGNCKVARYCSRECQEDDWKKHKTNCIEWKTALKCCEELIL